MTSMNRHDDGYVNVGLSFRLVSFMVRLIHILWLGALRKKKEGVLQLGVIAFEFTAEFSLGNNISNIIYLLSVE